MLRDSEITHLMNDMELGNHLARFELGLTVEPDVDHPAFAGAHPARPPWKIAWLLLMRVVEPAAVVRAAAAPQDGLEMVSLRYAKTSWRFEAAIGGRIDDPIAASVARDLGTSMDIARERIAQLSRDIRLLPPIAVDVAERLIPWADRRWLGRLGQFVHDPTLIDRILAERPACAAHFEGVKRRGWNAEQRLIAAHGSLVAGIARQHVARGVELGQLASAGERGLASAAAEFDHRCGIPFRVYATGWIRQAIESAVTDGDVDIKAPISAQTIQFINEMMRHCRRLPAEQGGDPTAEELAIAMGTTTQHIEGVQRIRNGAGGPSGLTRFEDIVRMEMAFDGVC